jgi:hypothetical protein
MNTENNCDDWYGEDRECCHQSCLVTYRAKPWFAMAFCHQGDRDYGAKLEAAGLMSCNSSYMLVGPVEYTD